MSIGDTPEKYIGVPEGSLGGNISGGKDFADLNPIDSTPQQ